MTPLGYSWMTEGMKRICDNVLVVLEGGYNLDTIERGSEAIIRTLLVE